MFHLRKMPDLSSWAGAMTSLLPEREGEKVMEGHCGMEIDIACSGNNIEILRVADLVKKLEHDAHCQDGARALLSIHCVPSTISAD